MSSSDTQSNASEMVAEYLLEHPEFFNSYPEVLAQIKLKHECHGAISLIERQVNTLREQHHNAKTQLDSLIKIARDNDKLNERMHRLTLSILDAKTLNEIYIALDDSIRGDIKADAVNIKLFINPDDVDIEPDHELMQTIFVPMNDPKLNEFKSILGHEKPSCGQLQPEQLKYMFGDVAKDIKSTAVIPLGGSSCTSIDCPFLGILAIGSNDEERFHSSMGTVFLNNLGEIISRAIKSHLPLKKSLAN
ncbi:DUF484 family protein [Pseudomonadota bacterium]